MSEKIYAFWLSGIPGIGCKKIQYLLEHFGDPRGIFDASPKDLEKVRELRETDVEQIINSRKLDKIKYRYEEMRKKEIQFTFLGQPEYPGRLCELPDAPYSLFFRGALPEADRPMVAVVGGRKASYAGRQLAEQMGRQLAENGVAVVSGLARGIDIASQRGVLQIVGGRTYGILGCGIDQCYPQEHIESYMLMQDRGGVISEYPPGIPPLAAHFPMRNRIISGLSDAVLVIEAGNKSGSLITAEMGLEQGKDIFVVPGDVWDPAFEGSNRLLKEGAAPVTKTKDILDGLGIFLDEDVSEHKKKNEVMLETTEKMLYSYLGLEPIHLSEIVRVSGFSVQKTMEVLLSMEIKGLVKDTGNHYFAVVI